MSPTDEDSLMQSVLTTDWVFKTYVTSSRHIDDWTQQSTFGDVEVDDAQQAMQIEFGPRDLMFSTP